MSLIRMVIDLEAAGDVTQKTADEIAEKLWKYADSVVGPEYLGEKQGEDADYRWHVHKSTPDYLCPGCKENAADLLQ